MLNYTPSDQIWVTVDRWLVEVLLRLVPDVFVMTPAPAVCVR